MIVALLDVILLVVNGSRLGVPDVGGSAQHRSGRPLRCSPIGIKFRRIDVARSIGRTYRVVRLAAAGAALAAVAFTSGCGAGQQAATSEVVAAVPGGFATATPDASVPLGIVLVENAEIVYNGTAGYAAGDTAPLAMRVFNQTSNPVTITPGDVSFIDSHDHKAGSAGDLSWVTKASAAAAATPAPLPSPSAAPSDSASPSDTASPAPTQAPAIPPITIAPGSFVILAPSESQWLAITGLKAPLKPGTMVAFTLQAESNGSTVPLNVTATFAVPQEAATRAAVEPSAS
jgi:hypothetical protein